MGWREVRDTWDWDDPAASESRFRQMLDETSSADPETKAQIITQIARTQGMRRDFDGARKTLASVKPPKGAIPSISAALYWIESGRVENSSGNQEAARALFLKALKVAREAASEFLAIDAAHMMGVVEKGELSLAWNHRAIEMARSSADEWARSWQGSLLNNTGWTYYDMGEYAKALDLFEEAVVFRISQNKQKQTLIARYCVGKCLRAMGQTERALEIQRGLEQEHRTLDDEPGFVYEEIAECLDVLNREEEARPYFSLAYGILSKDEWLMAEEPERIASLKARF